MVINTWSNFSKRKNSTKRPNAAQARQRSVRLKENTSIENPVFLLSGNDYDLNYIEAFNHYYYVTDIISINNAQSEVHCSQDLLATYKNEILNTSAFIDFDTTANTEIIDSRLSVVCESTISSNAVLMRDDMSNAGVIVVSLLGTDSVGSYIIPKGNVSKLLPNFGDVYRNFLDEDNPFGAYKALITGLMKTGGNGVDYIKDIRLLPFNLTGDVTIFPLMLGDYELDIGGGRIDTRISKKVVSVDIPWQFNDWRNNAPYTDIHMYVPFIGNISLPTSQLQGYSKIYVVSSLDCLSGELAVVLHLGSEGGEVIGSYGASTAVSVMFGQSGINPNAVVTSVLGAAGFMATGNPVGFVGAGLNAISPFATSIGGISSGAAVGLDNYVRIWSNCHNTNIEPSSVSSVIGTPAGAVKRIGNLSGYVQTRNASVDISGLGNDKDTINALLNSGVYIE